jgi:hypothetical protein
MVVRLDGQWRRYTWSGLVIHPPTPALGHGERGMSTPWFIHRGVDTPRFADACPIQRGVPRVAVQLASCVFLVTSLIIGEL